MDSKSELVGRTEIRIPLRALVQIIAAILLAMPTAFIGRILAFAMAHIGESLKLIPLSWFLGSMGHGIAAAICFGMFLSRFRASLPTRVWCWVAVANFLVLTWPGLSFVSLQYFNSESFALASNWILYIMAVLLWLAWLPWWRPSWFSHTDVK